MCEHCGGPLPEGSRGPYCSIPCYKVGHGLCRFYGCYRGNLHGDYCYQHAQALDLIPAQAGEEDRDVQGN